jgi:hypothetical protein
MHNNTAILVWKDKREVYMPAEMVQTLTEKNCYDKPLSVQK